MIEPKRTLILTNAKLARAVAKLAARVPATNIIAEPRPAGTAAALTWASRVIEKRDGPDATMISVHADWAIGDEDGFCDVLAAAASAAETHQALVTVGVVPTRPDPGFGYIEPGDSVAPREPKLRRVARFVEKPTRERAAEMVNKGYLWNSGIFAWRVGDFLDEVRAVAPEVSTALARFPDKLEKFFAAIPRPVPVDTVVLERSKKVLVVTGDFGWDDVGTWGSLHRVRPLDANGNAISGAVHALDAQNNVVHAEDHQVVLYAVKDLVVIARDGLTVVTTIEGSADLKRLVESLPASLRTRT